MMMAAHPPLRVLARQIRDGQLSAEELVQGCLDRIAIQEPEIEAWAWIEPEATLAAARAADIAPEKGALHGIPVGVKDVIDTADMPTAYGSPIYKGHRPAADAAPVAAIREAGGLILGKAATCEFAGAHPGRTRNPSNTAHTPGGSSSGSAAAVAAGMVPVALGTQTAGSILRPASFCGVVGFKPTYGFISRAGVKPLAESLDTVGFLAARVDDAGWFAGNMMNRPDLADDAPLPRPPRLMVCRTDKWNHADSDGRAALGEAVRRLAEHGASVTEGVLPYSCDELMASGMVVLAAEARRAFAHEMRHAPELLSVRMREFLARAERDAPQHYDACQTYLEKARMALDDLLGGCDALVTLSAPGEAPEGLESTGDASFNFPWTLTHGPAVSVPGLSGARNLPVGIQFVGRRRADAHLLKVARWAEAILRES